MFIITLAELEHLGEAELHAMYHSILTDLTRRNLSAADCPLSRISLENIQRILHRKRAYKPRGPRF